MVVGKGADKKNIPSRDEYSFITYSQLFLKLRVSALTTPRYKKEASCPVLRAAQTYG